MKTKRFFLSAILVSVFFMQLNAQTIEKPVDELAANAVTKPVNAQQAKPEATIVFDKYKHDFGIIKESNGKVSTVFTFTNHGDSALVITKVEVSCGCTKPEWTQEPLAPGESGYIKATYDPTKRIYSFNKSLMVYSNGNPSKIVLSIFGNAIKQ